MLARHVHKTCAFLCEKHFVRRLHWKIPNSVWDIAVLRKIKPNNSIGRNSKFWMFDYFFQIRKLSCKQITFSDASDTHAFHCCRKNALKVAKHSLLTTIVKKVLFFAAFPAFTTCKNITDSQHSCTQHRLIKRIHTFELL